MGKALLLAGLLFAAVPASAQAHACYWSGYGWVCANLPFFMDPHPPRFDRRYDDRGYYERREHRHEYRGYDRGYR